MFATVVLAEAEETATAQTFFFHSWSEMLVTSSASIIVIALLVWKGLPVARTMLNGRSERIASEIDESESAKATAETRLSEVQTRVGGAEQERDRILAEARETAAALKQQIIARAGDEAEAIKVRAAADVESSKNQALADLHAEIADLAIAAAEAVVARNLDAGTQTELIDGYIEQLAGGTAS